MTTIYWDKTGPLLQYRDGVLIIEDLNPQQRLTWRVSTKEMFRVGLRCIMAAVIQFAVSPIGGNAEPTPE